MAKRNLKRLLALVLAGTMISGSIPVYANTVQNETVQDEVMPVAEEIAVSFNSNYAEVGQELSVTVTGATEVFYSWYVDGVLVSNEAAYTPAESDLESWIEVVVNDGTNEASAELYCSKLPVVYIDTGGQEIVSKEEYIDATIKIQGNAEYSDSGVLYEGATEIRGRGNSTWSQPKKPYRLKLDKKADVFGMGRSKHWVLLANYLDESLMRNTLAYDLSGEMGMEHLSTVWVDVVMNGEYVGNYQFCENVRVDEGRVEIFDWESFAEDSAAVIAEAESLDDDTAGDLETYMAETDMNWITTGSVNFNGTTYNLSTYETAFLELLAEDYGQSLEGIDELSSLITGGYILELDEYYDEVSKFTTDSGQPMMFKNPEFVGRNDQEGILGNDEMFGYVQSYVQAFEDAVQSDDYTAEYEGENVHYSELYDFEELIDYWLVTEIFFNEEMNKKSTYMYKGIDELMIMGPIWDMDWSAGAGGTSTGSMNQWATNYFSLNAQKNQWYKDLVQDPYFLMNVQERYWEIRNLELQDMLDIIDVHYDYLKESGEADGERWTGRISFSQDAQNLQYWLNTHVEWMDEQMATEDSFVAGFFETNDSLALTLTNADGSAVAVDLDEYAPADALVGTADDLVLNIAADGMSGNAEIFINGKITDTVALNNANAEHEISAAVLNAAVDTKNVIEVKVKDTSDNIIAENYITVKQSDCVHSYGDEWKSDEERHWKECECGDIAGLAKHTFEWVIDVEATETENGVKHEECTVCGFTRNENTEYEYVDIPTDPSDDSRDLPVDGMVAISGSEYPGTGSEGPDDLILDGDANTHWHTNYGTVAEGLDPEKRWVGVSLEEPTAVKGIRFLQRANGGNGLVTEYEVQYRESDDSEWITVASGTWDQNDTNWKYVGFPTVTAKQIRIVGIHTYAGSGIDRHMSCAEFRVVAGAGASVTTVNKTTLNNLITTAESLNAEDYVDFTAVTSALNAAKEIAADETATQTEVDEALAALNNAMSTLERVNPSDVIPVSEMTATAGDSQPGEGPEMAIDENEKTMWHTNWNEGPNHDNHWLQLELNNVYTVDGFHYLPRQSSNNGIITAYEIYASLDGVEWTKVAEGNWDTGTEWKTVSFAPVNAKYVKLVTVEALSDQSIKFASAAEVRLTGTIVGGTVTPPVVDEISVSFNNNYAEVGEALTVTVECESEVSYSWYVDGVLVSNEETYTPTASDQENWIEVVVSTGTSEASAKLYCSNLPVVYIDTEGGQEIVSKENYIDATIKIQGNSVYSDEGVLYEGATEIRGRGNSTWGQPKKPYRLKLDKKANVFDMGKSKHWVLLANYMDESLMRNTLAYNLSGSMGMEQMSTVWVDVILNGEYVGNYQLCENIRVDETRINMFDWESFAEEAAEIIAEAEGFDENKTDDLIDYMAEESMQWITSKTFTFDGATYNIDNYPAIETPSIDGGYILELDEYYDEVSKFKTNSNQPIMFKNPEFVATNSDMLSYVQAYVQAFEDAVQSDDYTAAYEGEDVHYSDLYDLDALVDYWLISEIFFNEELNKKSTYMYKEIGELMKMGPIWDMDWSSGGEGDTKHTNKWATLHFNTNAQADQWYKDLVQDPYFLMKAQERYWEIRDVQVQDMLDVMDDHYELLKVSGAADGVRWGKGETSFTNDYNNLETWMNNHITWMDAQMATEDSFDASFLDKDAALELAVTDAYGNTLEADTVEKAPADVLVESGTALLVDILGVAGDAEVFVNGRSYCTLSVTEEAASSNIAANALTAELGEKNVIEVKVYDANGKVAASNYVTVKTWGEQVIDPPVEPPVVEENEVVRLSGTTRYETGYKVADALKEELGVDKFDAVVVATGKNFADALAGSYLAVQKNAPIILTNGKDDNVATLHTYIAENVAAGGKVYILGGEAAVPASVEAIDGYDVVRLSGKSRYETNLAILAEAGIEETELIVATGKTFADSLSASAAKLPILLVKPGTVLTDEAKVIAEGMNKFYIIGGEGAVSADIAAELAAYGEVVRVSGKTRYETSVAVANTFFGDVEEAVVASGKNFPDGLCGGPLAAAMNAPLILTADGKTDAAVDYVAGEALASGFVLGGTRALNDESIVDVFALDSAEEIITK